jgi:hypothetical protein
MSVAGLVLEVVTVVWAPQAVLSEPLYEGRSLSQAEVNRGI